MTSNRQTLLTPFFVNPVFFLSTYLKWCLFYVTRVSVESFSINKKVSTSSILCDWRQGVYKAARCALTGFRVLKKSAFFDLLLKFLLFNTNRELAPHFALAWLPYFFKFNAVMFWNSRLLFDNQLLLIYKWYMKKKVLFGVDKEL